MDYEKAYKEALERAKSFQEKYGGDYAGYIFPELRESEDERIIKTLQEYVKNRNWPLNGPTQDEVLSWLEKQKGQDWNKKPCLTCQEYEKGHKQGYTEGCTVGYNKAMKEMEQKEPHYTKRNALFDKCVENCDPKTVEEVDKRVDDIMNMSELSAFEQALTNFIGYWEDDEERWPSKFVKKHGKHILDMAREELQKEQKPIQTDAEKEYVRTLKSLVADFVRANNYIERSYYQQIYDWLDGRHVEQKEKKPDTRDSDDLQLLGFIYDLLNEIEWNDNWAMSKDECLRRLNNYSPQKPAEWSEEDEKMLEGALNSLRRYQLSLPNFQVELQIRWLKSLRSHPKSSDNWKPSEEQMKALDKAIPVCIGVVGRDEVAPLESLYEQLKKL